MALKAWVVPRGSVGSTGETEMVFRATSVTVAVTGSLTMSRVLAVMSELPEARPKWAEHLKGWWQRLGSLEIVPEPNQTGS